MRHKPRPFLRRPIFWGPVIAVGLLITWWLAWMQPEGAKLASAQAQQASDQATVASLQAKLSQLHGIAKREAAAEHFLKVFGNEIPSGPDAPMLVVQVYRLAQKCNLKLESITDDAVNQASPNYATIPVSLVVSGSQQGIKYFIGGLYHLPRLLTIQQLQVSGPSNGDVVQGGGGTYRATISATAYTTSVTASSTAGSGSTASTG